MTLLKIISIFIIFLFLKMSTVTESVEVFENIGDNVVEFESKEEFDRYYKKNKEMIDNMKTRGLNRKFIIQGFKIGRKKGNIILYPLSLNKKESEKKEDSPTNNCNPEQQNNVSSADDLIEEWDQIREDVYNKLNNLHQRIMNLEKIINQM